VSQSVAVKKLMLISCWDDILMDRLIKCKEKKPGKEVEMNI